MRYRFKNHEQAERIRRLVRDRIVQAGRKDALLATGCHQDGCSHEQCEKKVLLWGPEYMVRAAKGAAGVFWLEFSSQTLPAYAVCCWADRADVSVLFAGSSTDLPSIERQLARAESLSVAPNNRVPYGFVQNGLIVALLWCGDMHLEHNGLKRRLNGLDSYVLEGWRLPVELYRAPGFMTEEWQNRFWHLVQSGTLLRLSERIAHLPGEMWMWSDGTTQPSIIFDAVDDCGPMFAARVPYHFWHTTEWERGEHNFDAQCKGKPYRHALRKAFN